MNETFLGAVTFAGLAGLWCAAAFRSLLQSGARVRLPPPLVVAEAHPASTSPRARSWLRSPGGMIVLGIVLLSLALVLPPPLVLVIALLVPVTMFARRFRSARVRRREIMATDDEVPQLLDLLAAGSSAGLAAPLALRRAAEGLRGPLAQHINDVTRAVDLGARWRDELWALSERLDLPDVRRAVAVLTRTETLGSSLEVATAELAASVRHARRAAVMERARAAPVKMLFPLVFLVLPAFLLLTVVPVLLTTVQSIR